MASHQAAIPPLKTAATWLMICSDNLRMGLLEARVIMTTTNIGSVKFIVLI